MKHYHYEDLKVADGVSSLSLNDKKRAKVENSNSDTTAVLASSKIADYEEKLIGLVSDMSGTLSNVTEQLKEKGCSSVMPMLTASDVVDRCVKTNFQPFRYQLVRRRNMHSIQH